MAATDDKRGGGDPTVATLLTWFLPGAGHLYLGRMRTALIGFAAVQGLYLAGVLLSGGRFLEYLPAEMRTRFAYVLTPEFGDFGALLLHYSRFGYGPGHPRPWPGTMDLGTTLTALAGIANVMLMARAHFDARHTDPLEPELGPHPATAALATWLVPGLGQVLQGRRGRGLLGFVLLVSLFVLGCFLAGFSNLDRERHFYYWAGQFLLGVPTLLAEQLHGHARMTQDHPYVDAGVVLGCVAGMLNVLLVLDAYGWSEARHLGEDPTDPRGEKARKARPKEPAAQGAEA